MKYLIDTNILIYFLKGHQSVVDHFLNTPTAYLYTSIINQAELLFGVFKSSSKKYNLARVEKLLGHLNVLPFCSGSSYIFGETKAELSHAGVIIDDADLIIGSIALYNKMCLVTNNTKHFARLKNLKIHNWFID